MMMRKTTMVFGLTTMLAGGGAAIAQAPPEQAPPEQAPPEQAPPEQASPKQAPTPLGQDGPRPGGDPSERQALLERFDADGDGTLSQEERGALRQHMQEQGQRGQRGERGQRGDRPDRGDRGGRGGWWGSPSQGLLGGPSGRVTRTLFRPDYMTRDLPLIVEALTLDEGQADVVDMLLEDYDASFRMAVEETQQAMLDLGEASGADDLERERVDALRADMQTMREEMRAAREAARPEPQNDESKDSQQSEETEEQREARRAERQAMREQFRERMHAVRDQFREVRKAQLESEVMQDMLSEQMVLLKQFQRIRLGMASEMSDALFAVLSETQIDNWDRLSAHLRRIRQLPEGRLQGEQTDLGPIIETTMADVEPQQAEGVRELMLSWELDLDEALSHRALHDQTAIFKMLEAMQQTDYEGILELMNKRQHRAEAVRDVTDAAIEAIAATLPAEQGADFRAASLQVGYERVFRTTRSQRTIEAATKLEGLDVETMAAIEALLLDCDAAIAAENEDILAVIRRHDQPREVRWIERMQQRAAGEEVRGFDEDGDPVRDAFDARGELDEVYLERLRDILGEERMAELPRSGRGARRGEWGDRGFGGPHGFDGDRDAMRQQFMQRFDTDGNGEIDDAEREKIGQFFREMREGGGFGGPTPRGDG